MVADVVPDPQRELPSHAVTVAPCPRRLVARMWNTCDVDVRPYHRAVDHPNGLGDLGSLLDAPSPAALLTYTRDGAADVSPVWFRYTGNAFEVVVAKSDVKLRHLGRDPRAVLLIFETVPPFRGVKIRADVELDEAAVDDARLAISSRYLGQQAAQAFVAERGEAVVVRLPASAARTWDLSGILPIAD